MEKMLNETKIIQKILAVINRRRYVLFLVLAFTAGCLCAGIFFIGQRSYTVGELDQRYNSQHDGATDIIGRLEEELGRERELNRQLRANNSRARELAEGLADSTARNVRNLQDAVAIIGEIREKLKVLEDFYNNSNSGNSSN